MPSTQLIIPDLLAHWPWPRIIDPNLPAVNDEANEWVQSLNLFDPSQFKKFKSCDFNRLGALTSPLKGKEHLRISCDLMNVFFAFDEYTDLADRDEAMKISRDVMNAFKHTDVPYENKLSEMARQFFKRTIDVVGDDAVGLERFITDFDAYTQSVIQEANDRTEGKIRGVEDYLALRRETCGVKPTFSFLALGLRIPNDVLQHPLVVSMVEGGTGLIGVVNDMHSYGMEHFRGLDGHNMITAIMKEYRVDLQAALDWLSGYVTKTISKFISDRKKLPSWGPDVDFALNEFFERVGRCVRGCDAWSYETSRYYGKSGHIIQTTRRLILQPQDRSYITKEQLQTSLA